MGRHDDDDASSSSSHEASLTVRVKQSGKSGIEVVEGTDGYFYISKVPTSHASIGNQQKLSVGDRILDINGISQERFQNQKHVIDLLESFQLEVQPREESEDACEDDDEEESDSGDGDYEEYDRDRSRSVAAQDNTHPNPRSIPNGYRNRRNDIVEQVDDSSEEDEESDDGDYEDEEVPTQRGRNTAICAASVGAVGAAAATTAAAANTSRGRHLLDDEEDSDNEDRERNARMKPNGCSQRNGSYNGCNQGAHDSDNRNNPHGRQGQKHDNEGESDYEDSDMEEEEHVVDEEARARAKANAAKRNRPTKTPTKSDFERPYVSKYQPNSRFMITVMKDDEFPDHGVILAEYKSKWKSEIYVAEIEPHGPFFKTALDRGDKILAINGKKHPSGFKTVQQATKILESKPKSTIFVMRPDPRTDEGYKWIMTNKT